MKESERTVRVLGSREHYAADHALVLRQRWDDTETTMQVRRVMCGGTTEELQIEVEIAKFGQRRTTRAHSSFVLPPELADRMAAACAKLRGGEPAGFVPTLSNEEFADLERRFPV